MFVTMCRYCLRIGVDMNFAWWSEKSCQTMTEGTWAPWLCLWFRALRGGDASALLCFVSDGDTDIDVPSQTWLNLEKHVAQVCLSSPWPSQMSNATSSSLLKISRRICDPYPILHKMIRTEISLPLTYIPTLYVARMFELVFGITSTSQRQPTFRSVNFSNVSSIVFSPSGKLARHPLPFGWCISSCHRRQLWPCQWVFLVSNGIRWGSNWDRTSGDIWWNWWRWESNLLAPCWGPENPSDFFGSYLSIPWLQNSIYKWSQSSMTWALRRKPRVLSCQGCTIFLA